MRTLEVGKEYTIGGQGICITPQYIKVTVVWFDDFDVTYRVEGDPRYYRTPIDRFKEIAKIDS